MLVGDNMIVTMVKMQAFYVSQVTGKYPLQCNSLFIKCYNIVRVLALYKSYWAATNKIFIYARPCVNKMTCAFFFQPGFRVSILLSCGAVFLLFEIWKKPEKNWPIFLSALTVWVLIQQATEIKPKKTPKLHVSQICRKTSWSKFWPKDRHSLGIKNSHQLVINDIQR